MTTITSAFACSILVLSAGPAPAEHEVRAAVERSLPFIQSEGQRWIDEKQCVSCHQVPFMVWSLNAAGDRGFAIDPQMLNTWRAWAADWKHMANKEQLEKGESATLSEHHDAVAQLLLGRSANVGESEVNDWPALFADRLAAGQLDDGSWKAGGQLPSQKRPLRETNEVTTLWALVALKSYPASDTLLAPRFEKAHLWLGDQTEGQSTECWAARLLLERVAGNGGEADRLQNALIQRQRPNGGWGWLTGDESDAFGTGVALYALSRDGLAPDHPAIAGGIRFLVESQQSDGSWAVKGTKKVKSQSVQPTATYWGTCWAVIGLVETLPMAEKH